MLGIINTRECDAFKLWHGPVLVWTTLLTKQLQYQRSLSGDGEDAGEDSDMYECCEGKPRSLPPAIQRSFEARTNYDYSEANYTIMLEF